MIAMTAWLTCGPSHCARAERLAYFAHAARQRVATSSQIGNQVKQAAVPLWKVIVGAPTPTNSNRARKGPVFLWSMTPRAHHFTRAK
jgi:hypothetical protein